ncbi:MAG TPA: nuclear transport factor 2 family protein [Desulfobacteria bacterium]|nr:nuclear transport factor 2 family protein [Desulfobacteria bacterium]
MKADKKTEAEIKAVLERMAEAYQNNDVDAVMGCYAPDPGVVSIGTGNDEKYIGPEQLRQAYERDFAQSESVSMTFDWLSVSIAAAGNVAWVASDITVHVLVSGKDLTFSGRLTGVMENRDGNWLIVQGHFSLPAAEQPDGQSFPETQKK